MKQVNGALAIGRFQSPDEYAISQGHQNRIHSTLALLWKEP